MKSTRVLSRQIAVHMSCDVAGLTFDAEFGTHFVSPVATVFTFSEAKVSISAFSTTTPPLEACMK